MSELEKEEIAARELAERELDKNRQLARQRKLDTAMVDNWQDIPVPVIPPGASLVEIAELFEPLAIMVLAKVAYQGQSESARIAAANSILDRSKGKPLQQQQIIVANVDFTAMLGDMLDIRKGVYVEAVEVVE